MMIVLAILMFSLLIFIHELGHFLTAKWAGMQVNEFAMGMGPTLFKFRRGETVYALRAFPIGGFVSVEGEDEDSDNPRAFSNIALYKRIIFVAAGALMNLVLGLLILGYLSTQMAGFGTTTVAEIWHQEPSNTEYLQEGDEILRISGSRVRTYNDMVYHFTRSRDGVLDLQVRRDGQVLSLNNVKFGMEEIEDGIQSIIIGFRVYGVQKTPMGIVKNTFNWTSSIVKQVWGSFIDLITGRYTVNQLSGPVGVTKAIGEVAEVQEDGTRDWNSVLLMMAFITVNLGVFNLLPVPALDGGRLLFLLVELVRRKPIPAKYEGWVHATGLLLLFGLMIFVTFNDIVKLVVG